MKVLFRFFLGMHICLFFAGCATINETETSEILQDTPPKTVKVVQKPSVKLEGVYHKIQEGETLWRIAKTYNVSVEEVVRGNSIPDVAELEVHQLVFIPGATQVRRIVQDGDINSKEFMWPVKGKILNYFNKPVNGRVNRGIDIRAKAGSEVLAARTGKVVFADFLTGFGHALILDHEDGYYSMYGNNAKLLVNLGDSVLKRTPIAQVGKINKNPSTAHFEIRQKDKAINPLHYLPRK